MNGADAIALYTDTGTGTRCAFLCYNERALSTVNDMLGIFRALGFPCYIVRVYLKGAQF